MYGVWSLLSLALPQIQNHYLPKHTAFEKSSIFIAILSKFAIFCFQAFFLIMKHASNSVISSTEMYSVKSINCFPHFFSSFRIHKSIVNFWIFKVEDIDVKGNLCDFFQFFLCFCCSKFVHVIVWPLYGRLTFNWLQTPIIRSFVESTFITIEQITSI